MRTVHTGGAKRPVQKTWTTVDLDTIGTTFQTTNLGTVQDPITIVSWRWHIMYDHSGGTPSVGRILSMGVYIQREGLAATPSVSLINGTTFVTPEENCIIARHFEYSGAEIDNGSPHSWEGHTKTMRKMKDGDTVTFWAINSDNTNTSRIHGSILFFAKH